MVSAKDTLQTGRKMQTEGKMQTIQLNHAIISINEILNLSLVSTSDESKNANTIAPLIWLDVSSQTQMLIKII